MTQEEQNVLMIKGLISELQDDQREACNMLAQSIRQSLEIAGDPVGTLVLALVGSEAQLKAA